MRLIDADELKEHKFTTTVANGVELEDVDVVGVDGLETAKLVASRKNQVPVVLIGHMVHSNHRGAVDHHGIVVTGILRDYAGELAIGVLDLVRLISYVKGHLLETVIVLDIGAGSDLREDAHLALTH